MKKITYIIGALLILILNESCNFAEGNQTKYSSAFNAQNTNAKLVANNNQRSSVKPQTISNIDFGNEYLYFKSKASNKYFTNTDNEVYLYTEIVAKQYENKSAKRSPLNLSLVIDRSGSMNGQKLHFAKEAANYVIDNLNSEDVISIVVYDNRVNTLLKSVNVNQKSKFKSLVSNIISGGSTNLSGGMINGYKEVNAKYKSNYINRVLLLSDGLANQGITDSKSLNKIAIDNNLEKGISISTFGIGADFNEDLMQSLAESGAGNYFFIESPDMIPSIFEKELNGLLNVVAQNIEVEIDIPNGFKVKQVLGFEKNYTQNAGKLTFNLRDISSESIKSFVVVFETSTAYSDVKFSSTLKYFDAIKDLKAKKISVDQKIAFTDKTELVQKNIDEEVMGQYAMFKSNELLKLTMNAIDARDYERAYALNAENTGLLKANSRYKDKVLELSVQDSLVKTYEQNIEKTKEMNEQERKVYQKETKQRNYQNKSKSYGRGFFK